MYKFKRIFVYIKVFLIMIAAEIVSLFVRRRPAFRDLWIVSERGVDARDNGYHFFKYLRTAHPEINAVYIISKDSPDREKVAKLGNLVDYGSFRHYLVFILAKVKVSSHIEGYSPDILFFHRFGKLFPSKAKDIHLQHGIIENDLPFCHAENAKLDMFVVSAVPEYDFVNGTFGHRPGVVKLTGLCRYDNLRRNDSPVRRILFMPTWRSAFRACSKPAFVQTEYFKQYDALLKSPELSALLEEYDYELVFYPHFEAQRFLDCFSSPSERIRLGNFESYDVQDLLINSDIMITDYSSVFFDYAYMRKPVVFFQFDESEFRQGHYKEGYFDYRRDGFGDIAETVDEVVKDLRRLIENGLKPDKVYLDRINAFFKFDDRDNCKRNFEAIQSLLND